jgi:SAM-dependent methyltransferase
MFTESADAYDAIYFAFKNYAAEATNVARHIESAHPNARSLLDVACGTGEHARYLHRDHKFQVDGIDLNERFIQLARSKVPDGQFDVADMMHFDLGRTYDAIICLFSSIGYVRTLAGVRQALECFRRHLAPNGVIIIEPWFAPGVLQNGYRHEQSAEANGMSVRRVGTTSIDGTISTLLFEYEITQNGQTRRASEIHQLGLFTHAEMLDAFGDSGLSVSYDAPTDLHRGLYVAQLAK